MTTVIEAGVRRVLLIDDDPDYLVVLALAIKRTPGIETVTANSAEDALTLLDTESFDLILTDLQLPGRSGLEFVRAARERGFRAPILVLTAHGSVSAAVDALRAGAQDYLQKPVEPERLNAVVALLIQNAPPVSRAAEVPHTSGEDRFEGILGNSQSIRDVFDRIGRVAQTDATVLIVGESGTGKELVARAIHRRSARANGPIVPVHTGAIPRELIASELFGHEKGSFTGAVNTADGKFDAALRGTLFLDEIGTMELAVQVALLRVLETFRFTRVGGRREREADVRIVAATNRDLLEMVKEGSFREDLYYRLNVFTIALPPLRDRPEDIALIASHYLGEFGKRYRTPARRFSQGAIERLCSYAWPGNVRELRNVMEQTSVFAPREEVQSEEVQLVSTRLTPASARPISIAPWARASQGSSPEAEIRSTPSVRPGETEHLPSAPSHDSLQPTAIERTFAANDPLSNGATLGPSYRPRVSTPPADPEVAVARHVLGAAAASYTDERLVLRFPIGTTVDQAEREIILRTLEVMGGNKQRASRVLGISRRCLYNKLASYGIHVAALATEEAAGEIEDDEKDAAIPVG